MTVRHADGSLACTCHEHRPECNCVVAFAPEPPAPLSPAQLAFLTLHATRLVTAHRWHFSDCALRATAGRRTATIWADDLADLIGRGLMEQGAGYADVRCTEAGREVGMQRNVEKERTSAE